MFTPRRNKSSNPSPSANSLDRKQEALREKEQQLQQKKEQLNQLINEAPRRREEYTQRRRRQIANDSRLAPKPLGDKRYDAVLAADATPLGARRLRAEKRDGKFLFIVLCIILIAVLFWVSRLVSNFFG